jgi:hypothetical protein
MRAELGVRTGVEAEQYYREKLHGITLYVVKRTLKMINSRLDDIMSKKGCDASNMYDEELLEAEQEFSDDDLEKETKKARKLAKRTGKKRTDGDMSDGSLEEGELPGERGGPAPRS